MPNFLQRIFSSDGFMPHGHCYLWMPELVWLHVISDGLTALAYISIPFMLVHFARKRRDIPFNWMFLCFGMFIIACGATHVMEIWTLWTPTYWLSGGVKAVTAVASVTTAWLLVRYMPQALAIPTPGQLQRAHDELTKAHGALEERVRERTLELTLKNQELADQIVERERIETALRASEVHLSTTLNSIGDAVIATDKSGAVVTMNPVAEHLTGWSFADAQGKSLQEIFQVIREETREAVENPVERVLREGNIVGLANHTLLIAKDGAERAIANSGSPIRDREGALTGVVLVFRDQTQEREASRALSTAEDRFRRLTQSGLVGIVVSDTEGNIHELNDAFLRIVGYSRDDFDTGNIHGTMLNTPEDLRPRAVVGEELQRVGVTQPWGKELVKKDGTRVPVLMGVTMLEAPLCLAIVLDLTELKRAERLAAERTNKLRENEVLLITTLESIREGVTIGDKQGLIVYQNQAAAAMLGPIPSASSAVDHLSRRGIFLPDGVTPWPENEALASRALSGEEFRDVEMFVQNDDVPKGVYISVNGGPLLGEAGAVRGTVMSFRDISNKKRLEVERARAVELELLSRREQEANRLKSEFLANMSHELRTPLNAILGFSELLLDGRVSQEAPEHNEFLQDILASGRHLLELVNSVLDLAKVESGKLDFFPTEVDLGKLVSEVVAVLRTIAVGKRIGFTVDVSPDLTDIMIDPGRFKQVLYNYISNALKFTPHNGNITISVKPEGLREFRVQVTDTGVGIKKSDLGRLFVEFQQLEADTTHSPSGTGLGLAVTKGMVIAQGGTVGVTSTEGQGSTFYAVLPRRHLVAENTEPVRGADDAKEGARILVVEDDVQDRKNVVDTLLRAGYEVDIARTGAEALEMCAEREYDAITLDLLLPDMNGVEILKSIRSGARNQTVPVIVITVVSERGALAGFAVHDMFTKPIRETELLYSFARAGVNSPVTGKILVVDDDPASLKLMATTLKQLGYQGVSFSRADEALRAAAVEPPMAVILDLQMPEMDGFEFLDRFRRLTGCAATPVIVWTVKDLSPREAARLRASAQAVVQKGQGPEANGGIIGELQALVVPAAKREAIKG